MTRHPTPANWRWWAVTLANIIRSFAEPREPTCAELIAMVDDRDARMRAALRGQRT